nr:hypothetical protein [Tanacetum cinerariifolium]
MKHAQPPPPSPLAPPPSSHRRHRRPPPPAKIPAELQNTPPTPIYSIHHTTRHHAPPLPPKPPPQPHPNATIYSTTDPSPSPPTAAPTADIHKFPSATSTTRNYATNHYRYSSPPPLSRRQPHQKDAFGFQSPRKDYTQGSVLLCKKVTRECLDVQFRTKGAFGCA